MEEKFFLKDTALNDRTNDAFHHEDYVKNLKKIIEEHDPPYNIALIGKWGVGKSSIINLLKEELRGKNEVVTHEINAWKYENDSLKKAFLKNLWQTLSNLDSKNNKKTNLIDTLTKSLRQTSIEAKIDDELNNPKETFKNFFSIMKIFLLLFLISSVVIITILYSWDMINAIFSKNTFKENSKDTFNIFKNNIWIAIVVAPLYKIFQDLLKSSLQTKMADVKLIKPIETADEYEELFKEAIADHKAKKPDFKKLVVIVDDLDRLSTKKVVAALDAIKAFVEINECIFIVTCDENILINALEKQKLNNSVDIDGELFLDKLFHFRIPLPPIIENDMSAYAKKIAKKEASGLVKLCGHQFEEIVDILIHAEVSTPRQVKKLLNTFTNNLLIATSRENNARKLEHKLLTGEEGKRFLAKLSVLQTDYHEIYLNTSKDFSYLEELVEFYLSDGMKENQVKNSVQKIFNNSGELYSVKSNYVGLMNFLIKTQHIRVENLAPFIYLAQDTIGLKAGDESQRAIRKNLISGNDKQIINLLNETNNTENLILAIIEEIKQSDPKDLPSVSKASIQLINYADDHKKELSNMISYKLSSIKPSTIRLWQIDVNNLIDVYHYSDYKPTIENNLDFILEELFSRSSEWKNPQGKTMKNSDYNQSIESTLEIILSNYKILPKSILNKVKQFLSIEKDIYAFYPFYYVRNLYENHKNLFDEIFGVQFFEQLVEDIKSNEEIDEQEINIEILFEISPMILTNHIDKFIDAFPKIINELSSKESLELFNLLAPYSHKINDIQGDNILISILNQDSQLLKKFKNETEIRELMTSLKILPLNFFEDNKKIEQFSNFIIEFEDFALEETLELIEHVINNKENDFNDFDLIYKNIINELLTSSKKEEALIKLNPLFSTTQRKNLFETVLKPYISVSNYDPSKFDRLTRVIRILTLNEENHFYLKDLMDYGSSFFTNGQWATKSGWATDFIELFSVTADVLEKDVIFKFVKNGLLSNVISRNDSSTNEMVIKSFRNIGKNMPDELLEDTLEFAVLNSDSDLSKLDTLELINSKSNRLLIDNSNSNFNIYLSFLINSLSTKVESFLNSLYSIYDNIPKENLVDLLINLNNLNQKSFTKNLSTIQRTTEKFYLNLESEAARAEVIQNAINNDVSSETIVKALFGKMHSNIIAPVLEKIIEQSDQLTDNEHKSLLKVCIPYYNSLKKASMANLIVDTLRYNDDQFIADICDILLNNYLNFKFSREKSLISNQIVGTFRNVNLNTKEKVLQISKLFSLEKEFENAIQNDLLSNDEKELVFKVLGFRRKRFL